MHPVSVKRFYYLTLMRLVFIIQLFYKLLDEKKKGDTAAEHHATRTKRQIYIYTSWKTGGTTQNKKANWASKSKIIKEKY